MSSGYVHVRTFVAIVAGILLGTLCAKRFKSWNIWWFAVAFSFGWFVHVIVYDYLIIIIKDVANKIYMAKFV